VLARATRSDCDSETVSVSGHLVSFRTRHQAGQIIVDSYPPDPDPAGELRARAVPVAERPPGLAAPPLWLECSVRLPG